MKRLLLSAWIAVVAAVSVCPPAMAVETNFPAGSWIIPMDEPYQHEVGQGLFEAYGYVYELLANNVTVYWMINDQKTSNDQIDFTIHDATTNPVVALVNHAGGTTALAGGRPGKSVPPRRRKLC